MDEYLVPTQFGEDEFYEKKSHFIGRLWPVETEEAALELIGAMKKQHYDVLLRQSLVLKNTCTYLVFLFFRFGFFFRHIAPHLKKSFLNFA